MEADTSDAILWLWVCGFVWEDLEPTTRNYVNGVEYNGLILDRLPHTEGEIVKNASGTYVYEYTLKDHLGNTRVTFGDANNDGIVENTDIKQLNHYYGFGLNMEGPASGMQGVNKYQYNEKELNTDFGLNWNDYGARFYDASRLQFTSVDPLAEKFSRWSPYNYGMNNPIRFVDPTGMESEAANFGSEPRGAAYDAYKIEEAVI